MSKHVVIVYPLWNQQTEEEQNELNIHSDNSSEGITMNHRPFIGDIIVQISDGYPDTVFEIERLIVLYETTSKNQEITYWHAYCKPINYDFSSTSYLAKTNDIGKMAAHAVLQRARFASRYGLPPKGYDKESYKEKCIQEVNDLIKDYQENKKEDQEKKKKILWD